MKIPQDIWPILLQALIAMENNDDTMSGKPAAEAEKVRDWLLSQELE